MTKLLLLAGALLCAAALCDCNAQGASPAPVFSPQPGVSPCPTDDTNCQPL